MARKITFLTSLPTWIVLLPICVRGIEWNSVDVCNTTREPSCYPTDPTHIWTVNLDCSRPDVVTVLYSDYSGHPGSPLGKIASVYEIRLQCTDGNVQVERTVNCSINSFGGGTPVEGPYTFKDLSVSGILPGWRCTITGCFTIFKELSTEELFVHTPAKKFVLPQCASGECTCADGVSTTGSTMTVMPDTSTVAAEGTTVGGIPAVKTDRDITVTVTDSLVTQDDSTTTEDTAYSDNSTGVTEVSTSSATVDLLYNTTDEIAIGQASDLNKHPGSYLTVLVVTLTLFIVNML